MAEFDEVHSAFVRGVMAGADGQELSNALISSGSLAEFLARVDAIVLLHQAQETGAKNG